MRNTMAILVLLVFVAGGIPLYDPPGSGGGWGAEGADIVVDADGGGDFTSIQDAIDAAGEGDTVLVKNGFYEGNISIEKEITLLGENKNDTVIIGHITLLDTEGRVENLSVQAPNPEEYDWNILVENSKNVTITNVHSEGAWVGIYLYSSDKCEISHCRVISYGFSILMKNASEDNYIHNNSCEGYWYRGITAEENSNRNIIAHNLISRGSISIEESSYNQVYNNELKLVEEIPTEWDSDINRTSIELTDATHNVLRNNSIRNGGLFIYGRHLEDWYTNTIDTSNTVEGKPVVFKYNITGGTVPPGAGMVILANCTNVIVENQTFGDCSGIILGHSDNVTVRNNNGCVILYYSDECKILENEYGGILTGLILSKSDKNIIDGFKNTEYGWKSSIRMSYSHSNTFQNLDINNIGWGWDIRNCYNISIVESRFLNSWGGNPLVIYESDYINISKCLFAFNSDGIMTHDSSELFISDCMFISNIRYGSHLSPGSNSLVKDNFFLGNGDDGLYLGSGEQPQVSKNLFISNNYGLWLSKNEQCSIIDNIFSNNADCGLLNQQDDGSKIYDNTFIDNEEQVKDYDCTTFYSISAQWRNWSGHGNYWSDYDGVDNGADNRTAGDGIGDTNLPFPEKTYWAVHPDEGYDNHPLMEPTPLDAPIVSHVGPMDSSELNTSDIKLQWELVRGNPAEVTYDVLVYTYEPHFYYKMHGPEMMYENTTREPENRDVVIYSGITGTQLILKPTEDNIIYNWLVIPYKGSERGIPFSGVWSFNYSMDHGPFDVIIRGPEYIDVFLGETGEFNFVVTNVGTLEDEYLLYNTTGRLERAIEIIWQDGEQFVPDQSREGTVLAFTSRVSRPGIYYINITVRSKGAAESGFDVHDTLVVVVNITDEKRDSEGYNDRQDEDGDGLLKPIHTLSISILSIGLGILAAATYHIWHPGLLFRIFPLFGRTRKAKEDRKWRARIYHTVASRPGIHFAGIRAWLDVSNGTLVYNLRALIDEGRITSRRDGLKKKFYPLDTELHQKPPESMTMPEKIAIVVRDNPGITQTEIAFLLDESKQRVHYQVKKMAERGLLLVEKDGNRHTSVHFTEGKKAERMQQRIFGKTLEPEKEGAKELEESTQ